MIKTGTGQQNIIIIEIITDSREMLRHHIVHSDSREIELRTGNRNQYINKIIDKKRSDQHKRNLFKPLKTKQEIINSHNPNLDNFFASAEQFLFRCQPSVEFSEHFPSMWFSEPFNMGYFAYYPDWEKDD